VNFYEPDALVDNGFATGGLAVDNDKAVVHRARLCPQGAQARKPTMYKTSKPKVTRPGLIPRTGMVSDYQR
jgi:hypothetical protein